MLEAGKSPRFRRLETYQRYWDCSIYEGRPGFLDQSIDVPLLERAPCIVYPIVRAATQTITSMSMGLGKFPEILSMTSEDDTLFDPRFGLNTADSAILDAGVKKISEQARLPAVAIQLCETSLVQGTCVPIVSINQGRLRVSQLDPKTCTPTFNAQNSEVVDSIEVSYRYLDEYFDSSLQEYCKRVMQCRRIIDKTNDTTFVPIEVKHNKDFPVPGTPDKTKTFTHGFGFCPVVWYAHRTSLSDTQSFDGKPIHWGLASQLDALHFAYSQRHRAAMYCGDPQYWETGVDPENDLQAMGRVAAIAQPTALNPSGKNMAGGWAFGTGGAGGGKKRRKGPGAVWQYASPESKVGMLSLPGDALKAVDMHASDLRVKICEALGITFVDPSQLKGAGDISGKTLAFIFALQVATCNALREDFGRKLLLPLMNLIYRVVLSPAAASGGLYLAGVQDMIKVLGRFNAPVGDGKQTNWFEPAQKLIWGEYFEPSDVDEATRGAVSIQALQNGLVTLPTAVAHIRGIFPDITNVDQYVLSLQAEKAQRDADEIAKAGALAKATNVASPGGKGKPGKGKAGAKKKVDEPSAQAESASGNPVPRRQSPETRAWRKTKKTQ